MIKAKARKKPGVMNKTEASYADYLEIQRRADQIIDWKYEPEKLRLADLTFYTPDFRVVTIAGEIEFHEVKGSWKAPHQDDARVKIKVAAEQHQMYRFISAEQVSKKAGGGWKFTEF